MSKNITHLILRVNEFPQFRRDRIERTAHGTAKPHDDPETEYLSDGLTDSIINDLALLPGLRVISRHSVFLYKGRQTDPITVGRELNVRAVITGRLVQHGDDLTIFAELTDAVENKLMTRYHNMGS